MLRRTVLYTQELIRFPKLNLPPDIRRMLSTQRTNDPWLPESTPNPSLLGMGEDPAANITHVNSTQYDKTKQRIPMERRYTRTRYTHHLTKPS